ncbi:alkaline phosphatase family protein [Mycobacterium marseillense]|uniref:alkaline phosphatase family protein n=1 Tax=Mycobacterium marseillense TaxID=701042 RepID=UPI00259A4D79|nr:alkaline phosphatase family protein [Mycobacterium marseillense]MDM3977052.1 alkaline phosphatase family protein [Mycobacterium marseillense]
MSGSLCDVLPAAAALLGVPGAVDTLAVTDRAGPERIDRVLVVLVDGLGWHLLPQLAGGAPLLASVLSGATGWLTQLECTFPSTTPTSLVSLGTGALPGEHGVLGFTLRVPGTETVLNHVRWRDDPSPAVWQPVPTWFQRLKEAGVSARAVLPALFLGSGLTEAAYRGAEFRPAGPADDYARLVVDDHGGLNVPPEARVDLDADPGLAQGVRVVAGEPRVRYLHTEPGAGPDVRAAWAEVLGGRATVYSREEAVSTGMFGPVAAAHLERIGDVVVVCSGDTAVLASAHEPPEASRLVGFHGGASPAEMAIPLIVFRP